MVLKLVSHHVKKILSMDDPFFRSKIRNEIQNISREKPAYPDPMYRAQPNQQKIPMHLISKKTFNLDISLLENDINIDFEENSPHQEGVISKTYQRPDQSHFQEPPELQG